MKRPVHGRALRVLVLAFACAACASSTPDLRFVPAVQDVDLRADSGAVEARLLVAWLGVGAVEEGSELRFRVRVENPGFLPFTLVPAEFELLDGALQSFGPALAEVPAAVEAGGTQTFELAFRVPGLELFELSSLTLRVRFQGGRWSWSTNFARAARAPDYDPYWEWGYGVRLGATWSR